MNRLDYIRYVKTSEVARVLGLSYMTLYSRLKRKKVHSHRGMMSVDDLGIVIEQNRSRIKPRPANRYLCNKVDNKVCEHFDVKKSDIYSTSRHSIHTEPRHIIWYILSEKYRLPILKIARRYKRTGHAVDEAIKKVRDIRSYDKNFNETLNNLL